MKKKELAMKESDEAREMRESIEEMEREGLQPVLNDYLYV